MRWKRAGCKMWQKFRVFPKAHWIGGMELTIEPVYLHWN